MKLQQLKMLNLGIQPLKNHDILVLSSAVDWIEDNTSFIFDYENLEKTPSNIRLFMIKFNEIMSIPIGVSSESIEGLSQSFNGASKSDLIWQYANELLNKWLIPQVEFISTSKRWRYN